MQMEQQLLQLVEQELLPFHYEWFNASNISQGQDSITAIGLAAGDYYVTITDANGCVSSSGIGTVNQPL